MRQILLDYKKGKVRVENVPSPILRPKGVLVENAFSLISPGTERQRIENAKKSLLGKAKSRPEEVKKLLKIIREQGIFKAYRMAKGRLEMPLPLGYSCAGVVIESGVDEFKPGDRVACAGGGYANHAEVIFVPQNLCVKVPDNVGLEYAAFTTLGAIAMQGIRQADVKLGETIVVIGLGLLGQLTVQILKASGCRVIGLDIDEWKVDLAKRLGIDLAFNTQISNPKSQILSFTDGYGVDAAIITAATKGNEPFLLAPEIIRDRGKVVLVGIAKIDFPREPYYRKELSLILSRSYGPGRYDTAYEEKGIDYPIGYVRWTEKRNMQAFLQLLGSGCLTLDPLITHRFKIDDALKAYDLILGKGKEKYLGILLEYSHVKEDEPRTKHYALRPSLLEPTTSNRQPITAIGLGFIGAGNFAQNFLLPNLKKLQKSHRIIFKGIATATGLTASHIGKKYGFEYSTSDYKELLKDKDINTIFIATRHNLHAKFIIESLKAGKNVFCEKPLCLNQSELEEIIKVYQSLVASNQLPVLMVGFNRRFSPFAKEIKKFFKNRGNPLVMNYRINAGFIPRDNWYQDSEEGGGRIIGEGCHFIDLMQYITGSYPIKIFAESVSSKDINMMQNDNINISFKFKDGSIGTINYIACGDSSFSKERFEVFGEGSVAIIDNFKTATFVRNGKSRKIGKFGQDKGYKAELLAFIEAIKNGEDAPIEFKALVTATAVTFKIIDSLNKGMPVEFDLLSLMKF